VKSLLHKVDDARLQHGRREYEGQRFGHALQAVSHGDQDVVDAAPF
jgi:hypothetical protein